MAHDSTIFDLPLLEWLDIPAGHITLADVGLFEIKPFKIAKYPVTNEQFAVFVKDGGYKNQSWWEGLNHNPGSPRPSDWREADAPKLEVCWYEAVAFCRWLSGVTDLNVRLPTEWEWQWAAVGDSAWAYPYGNDFDPQKCNGKESGLERTNIVTRFEDVKTHFGAVDMSGNVWEWCLNEGAAPYNTQLEGDENRALRGGSWNNNEKQTQVISRTSRAVRTRTFNIGFRVMVAGQ